MANFHQDFARRSLLGPSEFNWRAYISQQKIFTGHNGKFWSRFWLFFMSRPLEKFTVCQYVFCYHKNHLQTIKKETTAPELTALLIHLWSLLVYGAIDCHFSLKPFGPKIYLSNKRYLICTYITVWLVQRFTKVHPAIGSLKNPKRK